MTTVTPQSAISKRATGMTSEVKFVIFASSLGTTFEWYDFYLYAVLAPFFASLFFPPGNDTAALLSAFATYAAGFLVRPFGSLFFGRIAREEQMMLESFGDEYRDYMSKTYRICPLIF